MLKQTRHHRNLELNTLMPSLSTNGIAMVISQNCPMFSHVPTSDTNTKTFYQWKSSYYSTQHKGNVPRNMSDTERYISSGLRVI